MKLGRHSFNRWQLPLTLVLFLTGLLLVMALRSLAASDSNPTRLQNDNLVNLIKTQEHEIAGIQADISARRNLLNNSQLTSVSGKQALVTLQSQIQQLDILAGYTEVKGPGLLISLDDNRKDAEAAQARNPAQFKPDDFLIHDRNLLYVVNDLRAAGAEAISVNDQRVVASTEFRCAGNTILVNTTRLAPPYIIRAIGDQDSLSSTLELPESEFNILKMSGFPVSIERSPALLLPAYKGSYQFLFATPKAGSVPSLP
ncbi:MAG: DUF881 domain-containing protein [Thermacetogeniaceae bacterium]